VTIGPLGPIIDLSFMVTRARENALRAAGNAVPAPIAARFLIDTGASATNVCQSVIQQLGLTPTGQVNVLTPSTGATPVPMPQYDARIVFAFSELQYTVDAVPVTCTDFTAQGIHGLLGRDILARGLLVYHGDAGFCTLSM
jgi:hypothetical protein